MLATTSTATITSDPGILCFHHCYVKVFCFTLPHICPHCNEPLDADVDVDVNADADDSASASARADADLKAELDRSEQKPRLLLLPFRLPYPFVRATQHPCAIVLRPSTGDFLNDYSNATDLHIAVTTSGGDIVEFDRIGLRRHRRDDNPPEWRQSLLVGDVPEPWHDFWDEVLQQICAQTVRWSIASYAEETHNCYAFVLAFLQALGHAPLSEAARSKTTFCEQCIVPRTTTAGKYISLYRKLRRSGIYVHRQQPRHRNKPKGPASAVLNPSSSYAHSSDSCDGVGSSRSGNQKLPAKGYSSGSAAGITGSRPRPTLCTIEE
ncbi:MKRN2 opposite strand protein [Drosophila kikkawai]|uniref:MKRN2 opposite strand protein n=1 Tax=Drosophila kikkawai TaxID=30033 RepID=A0A6P4IH90_DROKI|nr:MKRN2 opposite strand protein [Drosophila kikkawai]XP_017022120.1 MKRN2 opposite strand protein [Drosophila kikkawai]XP_017022121.1 MKRN2 opposite strand protein [Drosophila kikkawai]